MTSFKPKLPPKAESFTMILPGISPDTATLSEQLLLKNNKEFHIFFNEKKFHNHLIHHLLAAYSFGASKEKIQEIFDIHAKDQRSLPPSSGKITRENYQEYLGKAESYTSFLHFFESEIERNGVIDTVRRWIWSGDLLARTVGGLYHPLIHIGYGLEFELSGIVAEGLAMAACTESNFLNIVPKQPDLVTSALLPVQAQVYAENYSSTARGIFSQFVDQLSSQISSKLNMSDKPTSDTNDRSTDKEETITSDVPEFLKNNQLIEIFSHMRNDTAFDVLKYDTPDKYDTMRSNNSIMERIRHYVDQWKVGENTNAIQEKLKELYTAVAILLGATSIRKEYPDALKLDFNFTHALTSIEFVHQFVSKVAPSEAVSLIRAHLGITLFYFVAKGRPKFNIDGLLNYSSPTKSNVSNNEWLTVFDRSLSCKEAHVIKAVRSCSVGQIIYGPYNDAHLNTIWLKIAQMVCDGDGKWSFESIGFEEAWKKDTN